MPVLSTWFVYCVSIFVIFIIVSSLNFLIAASEVEYASCHDTVMFVSNASVVLILCECMLYLSPLLNNGLTHVHLHTHMYTHTYICTHAHIRTLTHTCTCTHTHSRAHAHMHMHTYTFTCTCTRTRTHIHIHTALTVVIVISGFGFFTPILSPFLRHKVYFSGHCFL